MAPSQSNFFDASAERDFDDVPPCQPDREHDERHVDKEQGAPAGDLDEHATDRWPERRQRRRRGGPQAECAGPGGAFERVGDDRERAWDEQRAGDALEEPPEHEQLHVRREAAEHRRDPEPNQPDDEYPAPPIDVAERPGEHEERRKGGEVAGRDVRLPLEPAEERGWQLRPYLLEREVDERSVEEHDRRPEHRRGEGPALARGHPAECTDRPTWLTRRGRSVGMGLAEAVGAVHRAIHARSEGDLRLVAALGAQDGEVLAGGVGSLIAAWAAEVRGGVAGVTCGAPAGPAADAALRLSDVKPFSE